MIIDIYHIYIERAGMGSPHPPESMYQKRVNHFRHLFFNCFHPYISLLNTFMASIGTHERIAKMRVSKCPKLKFLLDFKNHQNGI